MSYLETLQASRQYLSPREVEQEYGIPATTLAYWRKPEIGGGPTYLRFGRRIKYRRSDIDGWITKQNPDV